MQSDSQTSSRAGVFRKAAPQSCLIEGFNNAPLFNFKGDASGAETLGQNQKTVERYDSATLNNSKKLCLVQYSKKKKNVCVETCTWRRSFKLTNTHQLLSIISKQATSAAWIILFKELFCLKFSLYWEYEQYNNTTVTNRDDSKVKTKYSIMLRKGKTLNHVAWCFPLVDEIKCIFTSVALK